MAVIADLIIKIIGIAGALGITLLGLAAAAYALFRTLGSKWLDAKFSERLASYKHAQEREMEHLRSQISATMDRTLKLHQWEFDVLPELWSRLFEADGFARSFVSRGQTYPDLERMHTVELYEFLERCPLANWEKEDLKIGENKNSRYQTMVFKTRLADALQRIGNYHSYLMKNGIFIPAPLKEKFHEMDQMIFEAVMERQHDHIAPIIGPGRFKKGDYLIEHGPAKMKTLETGVEERLLGPSKPFLRDAT